MSASLSVLFMSLLLVASSAFGLRQIDIPAREEFQLAIIPLIIKFKQ